MGNQLVGVAPSQIYPVEYYLNDHVDLCFDLSLGSTRFLKVARARSREGLVVVKVFAVHDPSLPLAEHKEKILKIKEQLASAFNCLPFQRVILTDKAGLLMREYCKYSVYDRMSTRPFLTPLEKKWITFQVLYALHTMHKLGVCHGDIKLENIMVTSWLWVLLTDIASFKPTFLPDDNPADFSYFFDTSRRRLCYLAPERFVGASETGLRNSSDDKTGGLLLSESPCKVGELVPSMDIFSAGCALIELWNDGTPALDLPGLLSYRNGTPRPGTLRVRDPAACTVLVDMLHSMTERNPRDRRSAELYLDEARGTLFPEYFYSFLQSYMLIFSSQPILPADEKIHRIHQDIRNIIKIFTQQSTAKNYRDLADETTECKQSDIDALDKDNFKVLDLNLLDLEEGEGEGKEEVKPPSGPDSEGLILITSLVTSCVRGLRHCTTKVYSLEIMLLLCENASPDTMLDRILPYIIHLSHDNASRVRVRAVHAAARCVCLAAAAAAATANVGANHANNANLFVEYLLPELAPRATDRSVAVRCALANNIASLAETAVRFLDQTQSVVGKEAPTVNYETELSALHEMIRSMVSSLLTDSQAIVKRTLVENGITKLCIFFGKQKANDVILSHMVTFLNESEEASLRACFFERLCGVCAYVGQHAAPIVTPLLHQGLSDPSEWIIAAALRCTASLAKLGLWQKQTLYYFVLESVSYMAHPNLWIRHEVCGLIATVASLLSLVDVGCKIMPLVWPHLRHKLYQLDSAALLLEGAAVPVPRAVLDAALRHNDLDRLTRELRERRNHRLRVKQNQVPQYTEMEPQLKNLFRRLASDGMTEHVENQLLAMGSHLRKIHRSSTQHITDAPGRLILKVSNISKSVQLEAGTSDNNVPSSGADKRTHKTSLSQESQMNTEWQHMFGQATEPQSIRVESTVSASSGGGGSPCASLSPAAPLVSHSLSYLQYSVAPCRLELRKLTARMQQKYQKSLRSVETSTDTENVLPPPSWRPGNTLLATLHEHKSRVSRLVNLPSARHLFASCSDDGTVRLWDTTTMEGNAYINKSKSMYNRSAGPLIGMSSCEGGQSLVTATEDSLFVLRVESCSSRMSYSQCRQVPGTCMDVSCHGDVIVYVTLEANVYGWDLRAPGNAWKLEGSLKHGVYTCVYANSGGYVAVGTSNGVISVWDTRFHVPVTTITHANCETIRRIVPSCDSEATVWAAGPRDVCAFSLESTQRARTLWPCYNSPQPLNYTPHSSHMTSAIYSGRSGEGEVVLTGGSDLRLRCWNVARPDRCTVLLDPDHAASPAYSYKVQIVEGTSVIQEICKKPTTASSSDENIYKSAENRSYYHITPITDITMAQATNCYLVSASADGIINIWK